MATIDNQLSAPPGIALRKCPLCEAEDPKKIKYDEMRRRISTWKELLQQHEASDAQFTLHKCYDQYINMVADSRSAQQQQSCDRDKKDIVRYHTLSFSTFVDHFMKPHQPTREIRNLQKNDDIESMYSLHLALMRKLLDDYKREGKDSDLKSYNDLAKSMKAINDVSISPRFLSFHTPRKSIHK